MNTVELNQRNIKTRIQFGWRVFCFTTTIRIDYNKYMQKIATKIFVYSSIVFGIIGILVVVTASGPNSPDTRAFEILMKLLFATVFIILPSFALSVAGRYLSNKE